MIYEIKISIKYSKPRIWRNVKIDPNISLNDLHKIIQTSMGWMNCHLHQFVKDRSFYGNPEMDEIGEMNFKDSRKFKVSQVMKTKGSSIIYEYDFGDGWAHDVKVMNIHDDENVIHPICIGGKRNCPFEDSGGIWGYQEKLEILKDENHEEYEDVAEWMGTDHDPDYFDLQETNKMLAEEDFGCLEI